MPHWDRSPQLRRLTECSKRFLMAKDFLDMKFVQAAGPLNFTTFLSMFGEKMHGSDSYDALVEAFKMFDPKGSGKMK